MSEETKRNRMMVSPTAKRNATSSPTKYNQGSHAISENVEFNRLLRTNSSSSSSSSYKDEEKEPISPCSIELPLSLDIEQPNGINDDPISPSSTTLPFSWKKLWEFTGPGFLMSIAFLDPGNLEGDLQAGAVAGYSLLWLLMWSTIMGLLIQLLALRLGVATGRHMAELCREEYPYWAGICLWLMTEVALIAADIQEVIGSAIAIKILTGGSLPLWAGVIITSFDCFIFLFLENYGVRKLEAFFGFLITTMALSFAWMFADTKPSGKALIVGVLVPRLNSKTIQMAVGLIGCVIAPHNVFLYSALVQSRNIDHTKKRQVQEALNYYTIESMIAIFVSFLINMFVMTIFAEGFHNTSEANSIGLANAGEFLEKRYGGAVLPILYIWGIGLLAAGQSSTITGTYAGEFIMGGFLDLHLKKWLRSVITRSCAIVPTMIVAIIFNRSDETLDALNEWLNVLQAMQIPFAVIPLLSLVTNEQIMGSFKIGTAMEVIAWSIAALIIVINGYVIVDFFNTEVKGLLLGFFVSLGTIPYVAFLSYLLLRSRGCWSSTEFPHKRLESFDHPIT